MRMYSKSEVELLLRAQALQKAKQTIDILVAISVGAMMGEPTGELLSFTGKALLDQFDKAKDELAPRMEELKALAKEFEGEAQEIQN